MPQETRTGSAAGRHRFRPRASQILGDCLGWRFSPRLPERPLSARTPWPSKCSGGRWRRAGRASSTAPISGERSGPTPCWLWRRPGTSRSRASIKPAGARAKGREHRQSFRWRQRHHRDGGRSFAASVCRVCRLPDGDGSAPLLRGTASEGPRRRAPQSSRADGASQERVAVLFAARQLQTGPAAKSGPGDGEIGPHRTGHVVPARSRAPRSTRGLWISLKELAEHGFVSASDFGWFGLSIPAGLEPSLQHVETTVDGCRT